MSNRASRTLAAALAVCVLCASGYALGGKDSKGKALYNERCMICHGAKGRGNGPAAVALTRPPRDFNNPDFWKQKDVDQLIAKTVKKGKGQMPAFKLSDEEIQEIVDYISHAFKGQGRKSE